MEAIISDNFLLHRSLVSFSSRLVSTRNPSFIHSSRRRCDWEPKSVVLSCSTFSSPVLDASIYGGWEELELMDGAEDSGILLSFRSLVRSLGIDDKKHVLLFLLGFFAALTVSRVRFSTIVLLPVSVLVFLGGFAIGAAQAGFVVRKIGSSGGGLGVLEEKLKQLEALFSDVDGKMSYLRKGLERGFDMDDLGMGDTENYIQIVEYVRVAIGEAQKSLMNSFSNDQLKCNFDFDFGEKKTNQKSIRKRMELRGLGINFSHFLTGILHESLIGTKTTKPKDNGLQFNSVDGKGPSFAALEREMDAGKAIAELKNSMVEDNGIPSSTGNHERIARKATEKDKCYNKEDDRDTNDVSMQNSAKYNYKISSFGSDMLSFEEDIDNQTSNLHSMTNHGSFQKFVFEQKCASGTINNHRTDSTNGNISQKQTKNDYLKESKSALYEHTLEIQSRAHESFQRSERFQHKENQMNGVDFEENTAKLKNRTMLGNHGPIDAKKDGRMPYSSNIANNEEFEHSIQEAAHLLKRARECMKAQTGEESDAMLYEAANLLSMAMVMRPQSILAVGQLGNTYLLHGELKLKFSRELRALLSRNDSLFSGKSGGLQFKKFDGVVAGKADIASILVSVCEECEGLLVEAGRKYRRVLSIDGSDSRALYNWGLALSFRAQLISDVGLEAAMDADKLYLAAIDKFNAMIKGSNSFVPGALFRWGSMLQQRSNLRRNDSRQKSKLLLQAKSLFEEALSMDSGNQLVRQALVSCISELNCSQLRA